MSKYERIIDKNIIHCFFIMHLPNSGLDGFILSVVKRGFSQFNADLPNLTGFEKYLGNNHMK